MRIERVLNYVFLIALIIFLMFALVNGQDEGVMKEGKVEIDRPKEIVEPIELVTRLDVTIIDGVNDKLIRLKNCKVIVMGKLHIVEDRFNYTKTFSNGDRYDITISIRPKE